MTLFGLTMSGGVIVIATVCDPVAPFLSVAVTVMLDMPLDVGMPDKAPPAKLSPPGKLPVSANVYGADPPNAEKVCDRLFPTVPLTAAGLTVIVGGAGLIVMVTLCDPVTPFLSVAVTVTMDV